MIVFYHSLSLLLCISQAMQRVYSALRYKLIENQLYDDCTSHFFLSKYHLCIFKIYFHFFADSLQPWGNHAKSPPGSNHILVQANSPTLHKGSSSSPEDYLNGGNVLLPVDSPCFSSNSLGGNIISEQSHSENDGLDDPQAKRKRVPISPGKKDEKYWDRRRKNNLAAKRSREAKRQKMEDELHKAKDALQENQKLKQEIEVLKAEINSLRRLLKDANMTLSLWIRARQTTETNSQLPPMLRANNATNMPFVSFPTTTSTL
jgi:hypothetical protein